MERKSEELKQKDVATQERKWIGRDESMAQLDMLQSLGLASSSYPEMTENNPKGNNTKKNKKNKNRKKQKKS
jgi:hypothetical protein